MYDVYGNFVVTCQDIDRYVKENDIQSIEPSNVYDIVNRIIYEHLFNLFLNQKEERRNAG